MQTKLIPAILDSKKDYFVEYQTGSGKTMSMLLGALAIAHKDLYDFGFISSKSYKKEYDPDNEIDAGLEPALNAFESPTAIIVVPNRELAIQIENWAKILISEAFTNLPSEYLLQSFVKGAEYEKLQEENLSKYGIPSIVVGTPSRLFELIVESQSIPITLRLKHIFIDEVDTIIKLLGKNANLDKRLVRLKNPKNGQILVESIFRQLEKNYPAIRNKSLPKISGSLKNTGDELNSNTTLPFNQLNKITAISEQIKNTRKKERLITEINRVESKIKSSDNINPINRDYKSHTVSIFCISATINSDLRKFLKSRGWFPNPVKVIQEIRKKTGNSSVLKSHAFSLPKQTTHSCIIVEDDTNMIRNLRMKEKSTESDEKASESSSKKGLDKFRNIPKKDQFKIKFTPDGLEILENDDTFDPDLILYNKGKNSSLDSDNNYNFGSAKTNSTELNNQYETGSSLVIDQEKYNNTMAECISNILLAEENLVKNVVVFLESSRNYKSFVEKLSDSGISKTRIIQPHDLLSISHQAETSNSDPELENSLNNLSNTTSSPSNINDLPNEALSFTEKNKIIVLTDSAGRGLDIEDVSHVIIAGIPKTASSYLHMSGRTGRFGKSGRVITLSINTKNIKSEGKIRGIYSKLGISNYPVDYIEN
ncbi:ATP-dependent RNA helicase MRH4, mitochondrial [Smittium culicis]|uniref:ATP-dependent RNA helicase n=1 Tax=Smittium culicis TaxID=133412 RepID=A0A1R1Y002_9FUNG|nr:ATP-dependent RNA helicase MRH4, mitochondrial [Smittium culicis]